MVAARRPATFTMAPFESSPSSDDAGGLFFDFELFRTASMLRAGQCGVYLGDLHEVEERRVERVWYALAPEGVKTERCGKKEEVTKKTQRGSRRSKGGKKQRRSSTIEEDVEVKKADPNLGRIEFALRWIHDPELVVTLPEQITRDEAHPDEEANSLLITLVRCRNLPVMDTGVFGGSSDPYCIIKVGDEQVKSTVRKKDLNPVWVESFELPNADKDQKVVFEVLDYDAYGASDPIGRFALPFLALSDRKLMRRWFVLKDQAGQKTGGKCEVALKWHVPASRYVFGPNSDTISERYTRPRRASGTSPRPRETPS